MTLAGAVTAGPRMGLLGLACIFSTLVAIDGPLLQKATHVEYAPIENQPLNFSVSVLPELPSFTFSGYIMGNQTGIPHFRAANSFNRTIPTPDGTAPNNLDFIIQPWMSAVEGPWLRASAMPGAVQGCPKRRECKLRIRAPALTSTACTSYQVPVDYHQVASFDSVTSENHAGPLDRNAFLVDISLVLGKEKEKINLITGVSQTTECKGVFNYTACTLEAVSQSWNS